MAEALLSVEGLTCGYRESVVLSEVSFSLPQGSSLALLGRNGTGKTTFLRLLLGELAPIGGEVRRGANVDVAYFDQQREQLLAPLVEEFLLHLLEDKTQIGRLRPYLVAEPQTVIGAALLGITDHFVGRVDLANLRFRVFAVGIPVGMVLEDQLAIGLFDLVGRGRPGDAENLIVVAFRSRHGSALSV